MLKAVRKPNQAVRLIGVGVTGIGQPIRQLGLWDMDNEKSRKLQEAVDELREKYGKNIIQHGELLTALPKRTRDYVSGGLCSSAL